MSLANRIQRNSEWMYNMSKEKNVEAQTEESPLKEVLGVSSKYNSCETPKCLQPLRITVPLAKPYLESDMLIHTDSTQEPEG